MISEIEPDIDMPKNWSTELAPNNKSSRLSRDQNISRENPGIPFGA